MKQLIFKMKKFPQKHKALEDFPPRFSGYTLQVIPWCTVIKATEVTLDLKVYVKTCLMIKMDTLSPSIKKLHLMVNFIYITIHNP